MTTSRYIVVNTATNEVINANAVFDDDSPPESTPEVLYVGPILANDPRATTQDGWIYNPGAGTFSPPGGSTSSGPPPKVIRQTVEASLAADAPATVLISTWTDIGLSTQLTTAGGSRVNVDATVYAGVLVGGAVRLLVNGPSFPTDTVVGPAFASAPVVAGAVPVQISASVNLPVTANDATYTFKVQIEGIGALASITARKASRIALTEYA